MPPAVARPMRRSGRLDVVDAVGLAVLVAWLAWVVAAGSLAGRPVPLSSAYLAAPLAAAAGVALGRVLGARTPAAPAGEVVLVGAAFVFLVLVATGGSGALPLSYANANAALGVQLLALAGLFGCSLPRGSLVRRRANAPDARERDPVERWRAGAFLASCVAAVGVTLMSDSQAGTLLLAPVLLVVVWAVLRRSAPPRALTAVVCVAAITAAASATLWLAARDPWPSQATRGLTETRRQLWDAAWRLWRDHPVAGAGPGAFLDANPFGQDADIAPAHSSILQVGAELGVVGVALFAALLGVGLALALRRSRTAGLVAATAWSALAVHGFIDHLYEFLPLTLAAGVVLGWAGARASEELDVAEGERPVVPRRR